jgi:hypothetical protein
MQTPKQQPLKLESTSENNKSRTDSLIQKTSIVTEIKLEPNSSQNDTMHLSSQSLAELKNKVISGPTIVRNITSSSVNRLANYMEDFNKRKGVNFKQTSISTL